MGPDEAIFYIRIGQNVDCGPQVDRQAFLGLLPE